MLDYIILGMVLRSELTGYNIKKEVESSIGNFYKVNYGRLYPALSKLTEKGHLAMNEHMQGKRLKKYYMATEQGKKLFLDWLSAPIDMSMSGDAQLAQIFFYGELPKEIRDKRLGEYEFFAQRAVNQLEGIAAMIPSEGMSEQDYFGISTLYYGLQNAHTTLRWLKHIKEQKSFSQFVRKYDE